MGSGSETVTTGYRYHVGMHLVLCQGPIDRVGRIVVGDRAAWIGNLEGGDVTANRTITIDRPELFGGESREGGIVGDVDVELGGATQPKNSYLMAQIGGAISAFRGVAALVLKSPNLGNVPRFKPWAVTVERQPITWPGAPSPMSIPHPSDSGLLNHFLANPAAIIYELIVHQKWGLGLSGNRVDWGSFSSAAQTLIDEEFGLSFLWTQQTSVEDFIKTVLQHIDGALFVDPDTALFRLRLIRDDYDPEDLDTLDPSNIVELRDLSWQGWGEVVSEVTVQYVDGDSDPDLDYSTPGPTWGNPSITVHNLAVMQIQGNQPVRQTNRYDGVTSAALANRLAARDLRQLSTPLARIELVLTGELAETIRPGDVYKFTWPDAGVGQMIIRMVEIDTGTLADGRVIVRATEDVFGAVQSEYSAPPPTDWVEPLNEPAPAPHRRLMEETYYQVAQRLGDDDDELAAIPDTAGFLITHAVRPSNDAFNYKVYVDDGGGYAIATTGHFCPTTTLTEGLGAEETTVQFDNGPASVDLSAVETPIIAYIDEEMVNVTSFNFSTGTMEIDRGIIDTVPVEHATGARVFFGGRGGRFQGRLDTEYSDGETINVRMLTATSIGVLQLAEAPTDNITFDGRFVRPYPPGRIRVNGLDHPERVNGDNVLSWAHRDRTLQTGNIVQQDTGSIGPEPGTTYTVRVFDPDTENLLRTVNSVAGTSQAYSEANEVADAGGYLSSIAWQVESVRDSFISWQFQERTAELHGFGRRFGENFGGSI